jgi:hypothetical protein
MVMVVRALIVGVLLLMQRLLPSAGAEDLTYRTELAAAVVAVTDDAQEQALLTSIARWESNYRRDVGECRRKGPQGELGPWQILARSDAERGLLCVSLEADARVALSRVRESLKACAALPAPERLAVYARGRCTSVEGRRLSRVRWVDGGAR